MSTATENDIYASLDQPVGDFSGDIDLDKMRFVPWPGRFLVKRFEQEKKTKGGLELPDQAQRKKNWGHIVALPVAKAPPGVEIGTVVLFLDGAGELIESLGDDYVLLDYRDDFDNDVLGIFEPKT